MRKLKVGDTVTVIAGNFRGTTGTISDIDIVRNRVVVDGVKKSNRFVRKNVMGSNAAGGVVEVNRWIHRSNVMIVDPKTNKRTRVGVVLENGKKSRITKKGQVAIDWDKPKVKSEKRNSKSEKNDKAKVKK